MESQLNKDNHLVQDEDEHSSKESKLSDPPFLADMGEHLSTLEMSILEKTADDAKEHLLTLESSTSEKAADDAKEHLPTLESSASEEIADDAKEKLLTHELTTSEKPTGDAKAQGVETMECDLKGEIPLTTEILHESLLATDLEQEVSTIEKTADDAKEKLTIHELTRSEHPTGDAKAQDVEVMECDPKREIPLTPQILHESLLATGLEQVTDVLYVAITGPDDVLCVVKEPMVYKSPHSNVYMFCGKIEENLSKDTRAEFEALLQDSKNRLEALLIDHHYLKPYRQSS